MINIILATKNKNLTTRINFYSDIFSIELKCKLKYY